MSIDTNAMISEYDMLNEFNEISSRYYVGVEVSKLRTGLLGYTTESIARGVGVNLLDSMFRAREQNVSTARQMITLQLAAAEFDIKSGIATPSTIDSFIAIPITAIMSIGEKDGNDVRFMLSKDSTITINGYDFRIDFDIEILAKFLSGTSASTYKYNYSAEYKTSDENKITDVNNPYIITSVRNYDDIVYVCMRVNLRQVNKTYDYYTVILNDDIDLIGIEFNYINQLAYFNVWYLPPASSTYVSIPLQNMLSNHRPSIGKYLVYDTTESGIIKITAEKQFVPEFNSQIRIDVYTTNGLGGVFTYSSAEATIILKSYEDEISYGATKALCLPAGNSIGGENVIGMEDLRTDIITTRKTLNGLETDVDLSTYFKKLDKINDILFIKKRSDIIERRYVAYMIPRTVEGYILPTSTTTLDYRLADFDAFYPATGRHVLKANNKFVVASFVDDGNNIDLVVNYKSINATDVINTPEKIANAITYGMPYLMIMNNEPDSISYYLNSVNQRCVVKPDFINNMTDNQFVVNFISIKRYAVLGDAEYTVTANVIPNGDISDIVKADGELDDDYKNRLVVYCTVYDNNTIIGYMAMTMNGYDKVGNYFEFIGKLSTEDYLSLTDKIEIVDSLCIPGTDTKSPIMVPGTDVKIGICVYRHEGVANGRYIYDDIIPGLEQYTLTNVYTNGTDLTNLFIDMTSMVRSTVSYVNNGLYDVAIEEVPLVRYNYLQTNAPRIVDIIQNTKKAFDKVVKLAINNFNIDYKFYRTYGKSKYFKLDDGVQLDRLDISVEFNLYLFLNATQVFNANILDSVKLYIKEFVEKLNFSTGQDSLFISNVTTAVERKFEIYVKAIELIVFNTYSIKVNNSVPRRIIYNVPNFDKMSSLEIREYVPEFLNVPFENIKINVIDKPL